LYNLIKSGFVAFSEDKKMVIDANENKIIKGIDSAIEEASYSDNASVEEAIAEAMLKDAQMEGLDIDDPATMLTLDTSELPENTEASRELADNIIEKANREAEEIINSAHDEAEALRGQAYDEADSIKQQARDEGYQAGYEEGSDAASAEHEQMMAELEQQKLANEQEFEQQKEQLLKDTEKKMVEWLCKMIPHITGVSIEGQEDVLLYMINNSMRDLDDSYHFVIKVSPDDYPMLVENKNKIYGATNPSIELEIFEDAKLSSMQCLIDTDNGMVNLSLDTQLNNLIKALKIMVKE
jgi:flagellar biosynthesis/type III secretory pathway protein FliH